MSATPQRSTGSLNDTVTDDADQLRTLVSAMLSGASKEESYLRDVATLCRSKPDFARQLLGLINRYYRLGQMAAAQYRMISDSIEQSLSATEPAATARAAASGLEARPRRPASTTTAELPPVARPPPRQPPGPTVTAPLPMTAPAPKASPPRPATTTLFTAAVERAPAPASRETAVPGRSSPAPERTAPPVGMPNPMPSREAPATRGDALSELLSGIEEPAPMPSSSSIGPGTVLRERYELQSLLGYGGMASVYKAVDRYRVSLGVEDCCVAVKLVDARSAGPAQVAALGREFHNAQQLSHPNIVNVYEIDHEGDTSFYTMELLEGEQLVQLLDRIGGGLPARYALAVVRDIGAAIAHAHSRGVVHADLKPQNIFITYGGQVRVLDFGGLSLSPYPAGGALREPWIEELRPQMDGDTYRTATPAYASCEQLEGQRIDPRDDIYGLACIAYELLTSAHPFDGKSATEARAQHLQARRPAALSASHWRSLRRGLAWQREQRPTQVLPWLEQLGVTTAAERLPPSHQLRAERPPRRWLPRLTTAALLLLAVTGVGWVLQQRGTLDWQQLLVPAAAHVHRAATRANAALTKVTSLIAVTASSSTTPSPSSDRPGPAAASTAPPPLATTATPSSPAALGPAPTPRRTASAATAAPPRAAALDGHSPPAARSAPASATIDAPAAPVPGGMAFASSSYAVADSAPAARLVIHRTGNSRGDIRFVWWTQEDTAKADVDYAPLGRRTERIPRGVNTVTIYVPIISNPLRHQSETFYVALAPAGTVDPEAPSARASVTIEQGG